MVAFAGPQEATCNRREDEWNTARRGFADCSEMLESVEIQAGSICTPDAFHAPAAPVALSQDIHVLCGQPLSLDLATCEEMIAAARSSGAILQTGHHLRSSLQVNAVMRVLRTGPPNRPIT